jgi:peptide methionine sulfoxide reductase msrA/msrB
MLKEASSVKKYILISMAVLLLMTAAACGIKSPVPSESGPSAEEPAAEPKDDSYVKQEGVDVIYLAGGCFWGTEELMQTIPGVLEATSGYANGEDGITPDYHSAGNEGFKETVRVEYDPDTVSLDMILYSYFRSIDPTITDRQGNDIGTQYQSGVYWADDAAKETVLQTAEVEKSRYPDFAVEIEPLRSFYDAEDYHQDYLEKNPDGYCHITAREFLLAANMIVDPANYRRPSADEIKAMLTEDQFAVTQEAATEAAFDNEYWDNHEKGLYVDIVTGEPLFSSSDKFDSGTGWPSFTKGIDENTLVLLSDNSLGIERLEVRSRAGNSHLGHVFYGKNESPSGVRYCINSASLRFVAYDDMETEGYGYLKDYVV